MQRWVQRVDLGFVPSGVAALALAAAGLGAGVLSQPFLAQPLLAQGTGQSAPVRQPAGQPAVQPTLEPTLEEVLAHPRRDDDRARDRWRNPAQTLAFFQVEPHMTVAEYGPGGGWYARVLAPWIATRGTYIGLSAAPPAAPPAPAASAAPTTSAPANPAPPPPMPPFAERFPAQIAAQTGLDPAQIIAFTSDAIPENRVGTVDRILVFRALHGMRNRHVMERELAAMRRLLADDGMIGVVQHRAPESASFAQSNGSRGYLRQSDVISMFHLNGFDLVATSEVNANPADPADWQPGVWVLPPNLAGPPQTRDRALAVGESDRMTLLFRKRA